WDRLPGGRVPDVEIADCIPDLVVELPRDGNTEREMDRKVREYFEFGVRMLWMIRYPERNAAVYSSHTDTKRVLATGTLSVGDVLPGFDVPLASLFKAIS